MLRRFIIILFPFLFFTTGCSEEEVRDYDNIPKETSLLEKQEQIMNTSIPYEDKEIHSIKVRNIGYLASVFNDINEVHLEVAKKSGLKPIENLKDAYAINVPIEKVENCDEFYLEDLTHSYPYLVPKAHELLKDIGRMFTETVKSRCGQTYIIRVTSILRTEHSVSRLRRRNVNATENSAHQYGTTFDISYVKFNQTNPNYILSQECLKNVLGEVLYDLRKQGRCYVKYERKQGCFHITAI